MQRRLSVVSFEARPTNGGSMKVAFCTQDMQHVDAHFGWAKNIAVYRVDKAGHAFLETFQFGGSMFEDGNEDKLVPKLDALADVSIVYLSAIGASAAARVVAKKIHPVKVEATDTIPALLDKLVATLNGNPPPWLRKALGETQELNFDDEED
ncbi:nitrogen fixation protein NifX [Azospirillum agricola]|nr:nitrogen fixation protein NifX [Azospirillum agricola]MBP2230194.1 nitrogen fixation protein NifX [Azospirillum agricola]